VAQSSRGGGNPRYRFYRGTIIIIWVMLTSALVKKTKLEIINGFQEVKVNFKVSM